MGEIADPAQHQLVFVAGLHRSGTTLIAQMLDEHPEVSGLSGTDVDRDEGQLIQDVVPRGRDLGGPGRFARAADAHLTEADVDRYPDAATRLLTSWSPHWDLGRRVLLEKSPPNLLRLRFLQQLFPDAAFVVIVRHPVAVAYATQFWAKSDPAEQIEHWLIAHETFEQDRGALRRLEFVRYEDLVHAPVDTMARIDEMVGIAPHVPATELKPATNTRYFKRFRHSRWLPASVKIAPMVRRYESRLAALGYGYSLRDRDTA